MNSLWTGFIYMGLLFFAKIGSGRSEDSDCVITGTYEKKGKKNSGKFYLTAWRI